MERTPGERRREVRVDYLVGGLRISLRADSTTPGPRSHVLGFTGALIDLGVSVRTKVASDTVGLRRLQRVPEGALLDKKKGPNFRVVMSDLLRVAVSIWSGIAVAFWSLRANADVIYERVAVLQSLSSWHLSKRKAVRVVETNGIMSRETANDRKALKFVRFASWMEKRVYRRADLIVAVSKSLAKEVERFSQVPENKILVVPNAIPKEILDIDLPHEPKPIIGFVGSLVKWQDVDKLLIAFANANLSRTMSIEIIGDGPEHSGLVSLASELGIENSVRFFGQRSRQESYSIMRHWCLAYSGHVASSSVAMYHSPLKLYEYAGLGIPVLGTRSGDSLNLMNAGLPYFEIDSNEEELEATLMHALHELTLKPPSHSAIRDAVAENNTWESRACQVISACSELKESRNAST